MPKIFIIEDDIRLREELVTLLARNGYETQSTVDFDRAVPEVVAAAPDLVLLDLSLPMMDGQMICRHLRQEASVPIIVVTSRCDDADELLSISMGADDFVSKPYNPLILLARIAAILRRGSASVGTIVSCGGVVLDISQGAVSHGDAQADLTKNEMHLLYVLMKRAGSIVSRADLQNELWQSDEFVDDNTLTVNINRLRRTLSSIGVPDGFLQTKRGLGYSVQA
jgi:DNA-binding response OmpR family regulator